MTEPRFITDPDRRRAYRAFKAASEFGVMTSASSSKNGGIVDGPFTSANALARRQSAVQHGLQAIVVARYPDPSTGVPTWFDIYGRTAETVLNAFVEKWNTPAPHGEPLPRLDEDPNFGKGRRR